MDFFQFLDKNSAALIPVFSTITGILLTQICNFLLKKNELENQIKLKKFENSMEFEKQNLINPIIEFIEVELMVIRKICEQQLKDAGLSGKIGGVNHLSKASIIAAKIKVFKNEEINKKFDEFIKKRWKINENTNKNEDNSKSIKEMKEAEMIASEILEIFRSREYIRKPWYKQLFLRPDTI